MLVFACFLVFFLLFISVRYLLKKKKDFFKKDGFINAQTIGNLKNKLWNLPIILLMVINYIWWKNVSLSGCKKLRYAQKFSHSDREIKRKCIAINGYNYKENWNWNIDLVEQMLLCLTKCIKIMITHCPLLRKYNAIDCGGQALIVRTLLTKYMKPIGNCDRFIEHHKYEIWYFHLLENEKTSQLIIFLFEQRITKFGEIKIKKWNSLFQIYTWYKQYRYWFNNSNLRSSFGQKRFLTTLYPTKIIRKLHRFVLCSLKQANIFKKV